MTHIGVMGTPAHTHPHTRTRLQHPLLALSRPPFHPYKEIEAGYALVAAAGTIDPITSRTSAGTTSTPTNGNEDPKLGRSALHDQRQGGAHAPRQHRLAEGKGSENMLVGCPVNVNTCALTLACCLNHNV